MGEPWVGIAEFGSAVWLARDMREGSRSRMSKAVVVITVPTGTNWGKVVPELGRLAVDAASDQRTVRLLCRTGNARAIVKSCGSGVW